MTTMRSNIPGVMVVRKWITRDLRRGDLHILRDVVQRAGGGQRDDQLRRLEYRGYLVMDGKRPRITTKGRLALLLRQFV